MYGRKQDSLTRGPLSLEWPPENMAFLCTQNCITRHTICQVMIYQPQIIMIFNILFGKFFWGEPDIPHSLVTGRGPSRWPSVWWHHYVFDNVVCSCPRGSGPDAFHQDKPIVYGPPHISSLWLYIHVYWQLNMFLNKLTGTSVGLTAWDMFVINKPTVLTVCI